MEQLRLSIIKTIGTEEEANFIVHHNHGGPVRDRGECPACDEVYSFHAGFAAA